MSELETEFTRAVGIDVPIICGAMYPCSNPELVAAASAAGGIGIIQPISMTYVHGHDLRDGIRLIKSITPNPVGFNALVEASSRVYLERMDKWVAIALEEGVRFFITALGDPRRITERVHAAGGIVYHDVTERRFADKALDAGVDGLICVNSRAGGHAGSRTPKQLMDELGDLGVPLVCAGGVGTPEELVEALDLGYAAVQMGTRFIATPECKAHDDYKNAIVRAKADDVVLTNKISGVDVAVIKTPSLEKAGLRAGPIMSRALRHPKLKHYARLFYTAKSIWQLKKSSLQGMNYKDFFQAGKSVEGIDGVEPVGDIIRRFAEHAAGQRAA